MNTNEVNPIFQLNCGETTSFVELNMDCQLKIFSFLSLEDVARVAEVCKVFQFVANETFKFEWKSKLARLSNDSKRSKLESTAILRNFGSQLQNVQIVFGRHKNDAFLSMIIDKCSSQLTQVDFSSTYSNIYKTHLSRYNIRRFNAKFVNLQRLQFDKSTSTITQPECIEQQFPALQELNYYGHPFQNRNVHKFLKLNAQVKSLCLFHPNDVHDAKNLIELIDQQLPNIEKLGLWIHGHADEIGHQSRYLKNLKQLKIHNYGKAANLYHLAISTESVVEMELKLGSCDEILIDFLCQYKQLSKLAIHMYYDSPFECKYLKKICKHLPKLTVIEICGYWRYFNHIDIVHLVHRHKQLAKLILGNDQWTDIPSDLNEIQKLLDSAQWKVAFSSTPRRHLNLVRVRKFENE